MSGNGFPVALAGYGASVLLLRANYEICMGLRGIYS